MAGRTRVAVLLSSWGILAGVTGLVLYDPTDYAPASLAGGLRWLAVLVTVILGGGLVLSGVRVWQDGLDYARGMRLPALTLVAIGAVFAVGSIPVLRPWAFTGLASGLRGMGVVAFFVCGGLCVAAGLWCYRRRTPRLPLILLAGLTGVGAFYPLDDAGLLVGTHPLVYVGLVFLFIAGPVLGVFYGWPALLGITEAVPIRRP